MATERNPTGTTVNNAVSIETAAGVLCMFPLCMYYFSAAQKNSESESANRAHDVALWGGHCRVMPEKNNNKNIIIVVIIFIIITLINCD